MRRLFALRAPQKSRKVRLSRFIPVIMSVIFFFFLIFLQRNVENQKRLRRHSGVRQRSGGTDGTSVATVRGGQERRAEKDIVLRGKVTADRLRIDATRLRIV